MSDAVFSPTGLSPTPEQLAIQLDRRRHVIVEANAGAAKTTTLALRLAQALTRGAEVDRILVLTYTDTNQLDAAHLPGNGAFAVVAAATVVARRASVRPGTVAAGGAGIGRRRSRVKRSASSASATSAEVDRCAGRSTSTGEPLRRRARSSSSIRTSSSHADRS